jgi:transcriptional regulator with XRE-family HTH domain
VEDIRQIFAGVLRDSRLAAGISQETLAAESGLDRTYISMLERGKRTPSIEVIWKLCRALQIAMVKLVGDLEQALAEAEQGAKSAVPPKRLKSGKPRKTRTKSP